MNQFKWEKTKEGTIRLLGVEMAPSELVIPDAIEGLPITEVGPYCFAKNKNLESVLLPDSVERIERMAFYNCSGLKKLTIGKNLTELGADAFMNCYRLAFLTVRGSALEKSGIRLILKQISHDLHVHFTEEQEAKLLFMEYYESYDEVAPAHLFGRNIEGEGFRARQFFKDGIFEYERYDATFTKACAEEKEDKLCDMAMYRLRYPIRLGADAESAYQNYVKEHLMLICKKAVEKRDMDCIAFLCEKQLMTPLALEGAIRFAAELEWAEGGAWMLRLKAQYFTEKSKKNRYEF